MLGLKGQDWFTLNNKQSFLTFCEEILKIFFRFTNFDKFENLFYNYTSFWELIYLALAYDPAASFKENFLLFVFEVYMNFLNLYFFIQKIYESDKVVFKDFAPSNLDSIKGFLIKTTIHVDELVDKLVNKSLESTVVDGFTIENYKLIQIDSYKEFRSGQLDQHKPGPSYKLRVIEKLNYCAEDLCYKHKHVQSQLVFQLLHSYRSIVITYDKLANSLKAMNHYTNRCDSDVLRPSSCNRKESYYRIFSNNISMVDEGSKVDVLDLSFTTPKDPLSSLTMICSICKVKVSGFARFCVKCFHGGHEDHVVEWFKMHRSCPRCVSCECVNYNEKRDMASASAVINPYVE